MHRYHYAPQREICAGVLVVCRDDLVLRVGSAGGSRYPKSWKGWPVEHFLDRSKVYRGDAVRWWWRSHWRKILPYQDWVSLRRRGVPRGPISRRLECRRLSTGGRGGGGCPPPICRSRVFGLVSLVPRRSADGICPRGVDGGRYSRPTRAPLWGVGGQTGSACF